MVIITLKNTNGFMVHTHNIEKKSTLPDIIVWRDRAFLRYDELIYVEASTYVVPSESEYSPKPQENYDYSKSGFFKCPICAQEVLVITDDKHKTHYLCPDCDREQIENYKIKKHIT